MTDNLRLKAEDAEDLRIISAILQDAIVPVGDMAYDAAASRFVMAVSRFRWEESGDAGHERVTCAVTVEGVTAVKSRSMDMTATGTMHELLALLPEDGALTLIFAGGAALRLELGTWSLRIEDFGAPWPAGCCPRHDDGAS